MKILRKRGAGRPTKFGAMMHIRCTPIHRAMMVALARRAGISLADQLRIVMETFLVREVGDGKISIRVKK